MPDQAAISRFVSGFLLLLVSRSLVLASPEGNDKALSRILKRIEETKGAVKNLKQQKKALTEELATIEKAYGEIAVSIKELQTATEENEGYLSNINQQVLENKKAITKISGQLEGQIRAAHAMGRNKRLKMLLNQQSSAYANRIMVYYDFLNHERLDKLELTKKLLLDLRHLENEAKATEQKLKQLTQEKKQEQTKLSKIKQTRSVLLKGLKKQQLSKTEDLNLLKKKEAQLRSLIDSIVEKKVNGFTGKNSRKSFLQSKGALSWPLRGRLKKRFGSQRGAGLWDGVLIEAKEGAEVKAVSEGLVVYSDWLKGYGLLIILDHGKGYMTLYAFNQSLYKSEGDTVSQGDIIASVGKSDGRAKAGLYFGIRKKGKALNPLKWCRKPRQGKVG